MHSKFLKSRLLILLTFTLALQPIISIKSMNPGILNNPTTTRMLDQIRNLTWPLVLYLANHSATVHKFVEHFDTSFKSNSGILAPIAPIQNEKTINRAETNTLTIKNDVIGNVLPIVQHSIPVIQEQVEPITKAEAIEKPKVVIKSPDITKTKPIDFGTLEPIKKPLTYEEMRKFNTLKEMREYDQAQANIRAQIEKNQNESPWHFTITEAQPKQRYPVYTAEDYDWQEYNLNLSKDKNKALDYLNYVNEFTEILLRSNSTDKIERTIARVQLANMQYFCGPARKDMQDVVSCIINECFNKNTGKLDKFGLSYEVHRDIVYFIDKMGHDKKIIELRKLVGENELNHLIFNKNYLIPKCKNLCKEYHSYKLDQVKWVEGFAFSSGYYTIDGICIEARSFNIHFPQIKECEFNRELIDDLNTFNALIIKYDYNRALKFVKDATDPVQKHWRETLINETFTKEGIIKKFVNDPLYKNISKSELISVQKDKSTDSKGQTLLQYINYSLALRHADKLTLESKYVKNASPKTDEVLYSFLDFIIDGNGQVDQKAIFNKLLSCLKIEDKELLNAFSDRGILNTFTNEFANKCRKLDHSKLPTNQDFIDCANQILFYENYLAKDIEACVRVTQGKNLFFKAFPDKTTINQNALTELKSLIGLLENPPAEISKFLQEIPENSYVSSENYVDLLLKLFVIENELKKQQKTFSVDQNLQKNEPLKNIPPNLPIPNNSGNQNNNLDPNDPENKKKTLEEQQKIKEVEDQFNNCECFKKENVKIDNKTKELQEHLTQGHVRKNEPKGFHIHSKNNPNGFKIKNKKVFGEGLEKIVEIEYLGKTKVSSVFPSSWNYKKVIEKIIEWAKKNPERIIKTTERGKKIFKIESPCCSRIIEIIADNKTGFVESAYPRIPRLHELTVDQLNCSHCVSKII